MLEKLKTTVWKANMRLRDEGLAVLTWGNASAFDPSSGLVVIKPSGVPYDSMTPDDMVVVSLDGTVAEGRLRPSSDTPTHLALYRAFRGVCGVVHTHSPEATAWAQAGIALPCYGTTHADCFHGDVPVTRMLTEAEVSSDYEGSTGAVIVELFRDADPLERPGALVAGHGPFTWGADVMAAVDVAVSLEEIAKMASRTRQLVSGGEVPRLPDYVMDKHYLRKHGKGAYYGQGACGTR